MWMQQRSLLLTAAAAMALILTTVVADEPLGSPGPTTPGRSSQTPEPLLNSEPPLSGKSEASGESEPGNLLEQVTTGVAPVSLAGAVRSLTDEVNGDLPNSDASSSLGSSSLDLLPAESQRGSATETAAVHSNESQESLDHEGDSEEAPASQGM